jgi:hypothetical protein
MISMRLFLLSIVCISILSGCSKAKSVRWLVVELQIVNGYTGEPLESSIILRYFDKGGLFSGGEVLENLGSTDAFGRMHLEQRIHNGESGFELRISHGPYYGNLGSGVTPFFKIPLDEKSENPETIQLWPKSPILLSLKNISCTDPTDTIWIDQQNSGYPLVIVGCADTTLFGGYGFTLLNDGPNITLDIITKKSGVINSYSESYLNLLPSEMNFLQLDY